MRPTFADRFNAATPEHHSMLLEQHRQLRAELERPLRVSYEAPRPETTNSLAQAYRQRTARQTRRWDANNELGAQRKAAMSDIGFV
jgi:hypothetical protein